MALHALRARRIWNLECPIELFRVVDPRHDAPHPLRVPVEPDPRMDLIAALEKSRRPGFPVVANHLNRAQNLSGVAG